MRKEMMQSIIVFIAAMTVLNKSYYDHLWSELDPIDLEDKNSSETSSKLYFCSLFPVACGAINYYMDVANNVTDVSADPWWKDLSEHEFMGRMEKVLMIKERDPNSLDNSLHTIKLNDSLQAGNYSQLWQSLYNLYARSDEFQCAFSGILSGNISFIISDEFYFLPKEKHPNWLAASFFYEKNVKFRADVPLINNMLVNKDDIAEHVHVILQELMHSVDNIYIGKESRYKKIIEIFKQELSKITLRVEKDSINFIKSVLSDDDLKRIKENNDQLYQLEIVLDHLESIIDTGTGDPRDNPDVFKEYHEIVKKRRKLENENQELASSIETLKVDSETYHKFSVSGIDFVNRSLIPLVWNTLVEIDSRYEDSHKVKEIYARLPFSADLLKILFPETLAQVKKVVEHMGIRPTCIVGIYSTIDEAGFNAGKRRAAERFINHMVEDLVFTTSVFALSACVLVYLDKKLDKKLDKEKVNSNLDEEKEITTQKKGS